MTSSTRTLTQTHQSNTSSTSQFVASPRFNLAPLLSCSICPSSAIDMFARGNRPELKSKWHTFQGFRLLMFVFSIEIRQRTRMNCKVEKLEVVLDSFNKKKKKNASPKSQLALDASAIQKVISETRLPGKMSINQISRLYDPILFAQRSSHSELESAFHLRQLLWRWTA